MNIEDIRKQYPQYSDLSDDQLLKGLHDKFYSDMPYEDFAVKVQGASVPAPGTQAQPEQPSQFMESLKGFGEDTLNVLGELAAAGNRSVTEFIDFVGPDTANAILSLAGREERVPTLTGALEKTGIQGGFMEPGTARDVVRAAGEVGIPFAGGATQVQRNVAKAPGMMAEFMGLGSAAPAATSAKTATNLALKRNTGDVATTPVMLNELGETVADPQAKEVTKQGFDEGFVAMVKASPAKARQKMLAMLDIVEKGKKNFRYAAEHRPLDIAGDSVLNRVKVVREANRIARGRLDSVAKSLRGQHVDHSPAVNQFLDDLSDMGVSFDAKARTLDFSGSDIEKVKGAQKVIRDVVDRMLNTKVPDAYDVHRLKRFIDEMVSYGKSPKGGLTGRSEGIVKSLRHNLDGILDDAFGEYNKVNTQYAETRGVIDALQDVAGQKMNLLGPNADKAMGTLTRRLLSNAQSRVPLTDAIGNLDTVARKYGSPGTDIVPYEAVLKHSGVPADALDDDVLGQVMFADQVDAFFGTHAKTSLQGDVAKAVERGVEDALTSGDTLYGMTREGVRWGANKIRGINEENAMKAMRELLERAQ